MATIFRIKRSDVAGNPGTLAQGEMAYSALVDNGANGGDRLYVGMGTETGGNATSHIVIGGKFFTDMLDHNKGTLTASSAIITDTNNKIDVINVDNLTLDGNTLSATDTNGNVILAPNGTGTIAASAARITGVADPTNDQDAVTKSFLVDYVTGGGGGTEAIQDIVGDMVSGNTENGIAVTYDDVNGKLDFDVEDPELSISGDGTGSATMTNLGDTDIAFTLATVNANVGSWGSTTEIPVFTVNGKGLVTAASQVSIATKLNVAADNGDGVDGVDLLTEKLSILGGEGIDANVIGNIFTISGEDADAAGNKGIASFDGTDFTVTGGVVAGNAITLGTSALNLGETTTAVAGLTELTVDNIKIDGNTISAIDVDGDVVLAPNGSGVVDANGARISGVATPTQSTDAATKAYADSLATGIDAKQSVRAATTGPITLANTQVIDGVSLAAGDRVLVKDQADAATNGIYDVVDAASWVRSSDFDEPYEVTANAYCFVEEGTANGNNGWVLTTDDPLTLGTSDLVWAQFSGAGQILAGDGLSKIGNELDVNVAANGGIEIVADDLQLKSSVAGAGTTYSNGVIDIVGTADRITVNADSIDIAATYVGQSTITTLGTVTTGTWNGDTIVVANGGTGITTVAARAMLVGDGTNPLTVLAGADTDGSFLSQDSTGNPAWTNEIDGGTY